jgi:CHAD domain-containing protein
VPATRIKSTEEHELKLAVEAGFELPELGGTELEPRLFTSTYHDAPDLRLARLGITLRRRTENGKALWQLKLPQGDHRLELEVPGPPVKPPAELTRLLVGVLRAAPLAPVATLRTRRKGIRVTRKSQPLADVVVDSVSVLQARRVVARFRELEIERINGGWKGLQKVERALRDAGAHPGDGRPKALQVLGLETATQKPRGDSEQLQAALRTQFLALAHADPAVRLDRDVEDLHDMRVAVRRLRAIIRAGAPALAPTLVEPLREELRWLGGLLGPVRDLDVLIAALRVEAEQFDGDEQVALRPFFAALSRERTAAKKTMRAGLESPRYLDLLDRLSGFVETPPEQPLSLKRVARGEFKKLRARMDALSDQPVDEELHRARIQGKRARYAAELAEPLVGKAARRVVADAKNFQDVIGAHQDAVVAEERLRSFIGRAKHGETALALGRLIERQHVHRHTAREQVPKAWAALERSGARAW